MKNIGYLMLLAAIVIFFNYNESRMTSDNSELVYTVRGEITEKTYIDFKNAITSSNKIKGVVLNSIGGNVDYAIRIATIIRDKGLLTQIPKGSVCNSACVYIFLSGKEAYKSGHLGIHQMTYKGMNRFECTSTKCVKALDQDLAYTKRYLNSIGFSSRFADLMNSIHHTDMYYITVEELKAYSL